MISILDYGMGNLASIQGMLKKVGVASRLIATPGEIEAAGALIVPGVGKFDHAMSRIEELGFRASLDAAALQRKIPVLGICLGAQLMTRSSEEGVRPGLGWIDATTRRLGASDPQLRVPHMGWNLLHGHQTSRYFRGDGLAEHRFYFAHAYAIRCNNPADVVATTHHGEDFASVLEHENLVGAQFHPEKSHKFGASFLRRYAIAHGLAAAAAA